MDSPQFAAMLVIVLTLLGLSAYFIWRQAKILRYLREHDDLPPEDRLYLRNQAWRRLACCTMMVVLAAQLDGAYLLGLEDQANDIAAQGEAQKAAGLEPVLNAEQRQFLRFYGFYWISILLVLLGILVLAAIDVLAIRRFGMRHHRQIMVERAEMIERQVARLRSERNGHG